MPETKKEPTPKWTVDNNAATLEIFIRDENDVAIGKVFGGFGAYPSAEVSQLWADAPRAKRQRDALLASLKAAMRGPMSVVEYHVAQALIRECDGENQ